MILFGDRLKEAREARGVTLDAIAQETHISRQYLDALERSDIETLPGGVFNKGYIRSFAQCLGIDPQAILEAYRLEERKLDRGTPENEQQMLQELSRLIDQRIERKPIHSLLSSSAARVGLASALLVTLLGGIWTLLATRSGPEQRVTSEPVSPVLPDDATAGGGENDTEAGTPSGSSSTLGEQAAGPTSRPDEPTETPSAEPEILPPLERRVRSETTGSRLDVTESGVGTDIVDRQLAGPSDRFPEGTRVWFWTRVVKGERGDVLRHIWLYEDRTVKIAELEVGGPHWRTYSNYDLSGSVGRWAVEARDADGRLLAREEFFCLPEPSLQTRR